MGGPLGDHLPASGHGIDQVQRSGSHLRRREVFDRDRLSIGRPGEADESIVAGGGEGSGNRPHDAAIEVPHDQGVGAPALLEVSRQVAGRGQTGQR